MFRTLPLKRCRKCVAKPRPCPSFPATGVGPMDAFKLCPSTCWCERGDSNPHGFTRQILSLVRLPIPPLSHLDDQSLTNSYQFALVEA